MESAEAPLAWYYELAGGLAEDGTYVNYRMCLTFSKPSVPEDSMRNLTPLYSKDQLCPPSPSTNQTTESTNEDRTD